MKNLFSIEGKVAVVTGGSRGIGEMIAAGFLANGAKVYVSSRKADVCNATAERLASEFGGECISVPADLSNIDGCEQLANAVAEREDQLDILVNNAGVSWGAPIDEFPEFGWDKVIVAPVDKLAAVSLATGPAGWLLAVSEDSFEAPTLWFSSDGTHWARVAELPITRASIGAPVIGMGADEMVAIKPGDPENAAFSGDSELAVWTSPDGVTWTEGEPGGFIDSGYLYDLQHTSMGWLAVGESYRNQHDVVPAVYHSNDGRSWNRVLRGEGGGAAFEVG